MMVDATQDEEAVELSTIGRGVGVRMNGVRDKRIVSDYISHMDLVDL